MKKQHLQEQIDTCRVYIRTYELQSIIELTAYRAMCSPDEWKSELSEILSQNPRFLSETAEAYKLNKKTMEFTAKRLEIHSIIECRNLLKALELQLSKTVQSENDGFVDNLLAKLFPN